MDSRSQGSSAASASEPPCTVRALGLDVHAERRADHAPVLPAFGVIAANEPLSVAGHDDVRPQVARDLPHLGAARVVPVGREARTCRPRRNTP